MNPHLGMKLAKETNQNAAFEVSLFPFNSGQTQITDQYFHDQTGHLKNTHISERMDCYKSKMKTSAPYHQKKNAQLKINSHTTLDSLNLFASSAKQELYKNRDQ